MKKKDKNILNQFIKQDFKKRYQGSVLGIIWVLLKPLAIFTILYLVFSFRFSAGKPHFSIHLLIGIMIYTLFSESTKYGLNALLSKSGIILKINFNRILTIYSGMINSLITFVFNMLVLIVFIIFERVPFHLISIPVMLISIIIFTLFNIGISFFLSILKITFRDISNIWDIVLRMGFYATPIFIPMDYYPPSIRKFVAANPVAVMMNINREAILYGEIRMDLKYIIFAISFSLVLFVLGIIFFKFKANKVAEYF